MVFAVGGLPQVPAALASRPAGAEEHDAADVAVVALERGAPLVGGRVYDRAEVDRRLPVAADFGRIPEVRAAVAAGPLRREDERFAVVREPSRVLVLGAVDDAAEVDGRIPPAAYFPRNPNVLAAETSRPGRTNIERLAVAREDRSTVDKGRVYGRADVGLSAGGRAASQRDPPDIRRAIAAGRGGDEVKFAIVVGEERRRLAESRVDEAAQVDGLLPRVADVVGPPEVAAAEAARAVGGEDHPFAVAAEEGVPLVSGGIKGRSQVSGRLPGGEGRGRGERCCYDISQHLSLLSIDLF